MIDKKTEKVVDLDCTLIFEELYSAKYGKYFYQRLGQHYLKNLPEGSYALQVALKPLPFTEPSL